MSEEQNNLNLQIQSEMKKSYIGGLFDGSGTVTVSVRKDDDYSLGYTMAPRVKLIRTKPFSIQMVDDWTAKNGIFATVRQYDDRYEFVINRVRDMFMFCEQLAPYVQDRLGEFELLVEGILPRLDRDEHLSDKKRFVEIVELCDELKQTSINSGGSTKYNANYFREEWDIA